MIREVVLPEISWVLTVAKRASMVLNLSSIDARIATPYQFFNDLCTLVERKKVWGKDELSPSAE